MLVFAASAKHRLVVFVVPHHGDHDIEANDHDHAPVVSPFRDRSVLKELSDNRWPVAMHRVTVPPGRA